MRKKERSLVFISSSFLSRAEQSRSKQYITKISRKIKRPSQKSSTLPIYLIHTRYLTCPCIDLNHSLAYSQTVVYTYLQLTTHFVLYLLQLSFLLFFLPFNTYLTVHLISHAWCQKKVLPSHDGRLKERMNLCAWEVSLQNTLFLGAWRYICINKVHMHIGCGFLEFVPIRNFEIF